MRHLKSINFAIVFLTVIAMGCSEVKKETSQSARDSDLNTEESQAIILLSGLPTLDTKDSIAIIELDPESPKFGHIIYEYALPKFDAPLHHLYYSPNGRLYATGLGTQCSLAEIALVRDVNATPIITGVDCLDTGGQSVGEDIMWHSVNDKLYMFVTFMGGTDVKQADAGSVGVFDPQTNKVIKIIEAPKSQVGEGKPYIMYPHGISAYGDRMVVTSTVHPDLATGIGNAITVIDLNRFEPIENIVIEDAKPVGFPSSPVEVLFIRPSIVQDVEPAVLVNTMFGFETWKIPYDKQSKAFGTPEKLYDGSKENTGVPLEFYGNEEELFISHAIPGVVKRYDLKQLPNLVSSGEDIKGELGTHHMIFYKTASGRKVIALQNNLLNLGNAADNDPTDIDFIAKVNAHSITVHDLATGERLGAVNFKERYQKGIDNIEALFGSGFVHHH
ncbi:hypothetical protein tinsulaeT_30790 [Thalassotalea insulae]|uniref:Methanethiol oxidase n=1 Tax=Thalassotalea insulae TaxID=2056778 RepID=A0ABQ6GVM4_9GAMM|nr:hypothetical protein [Thalassotalea insulae]GLX79739.1 hypothetical protein tinsulaeT_30790 [Thalassotalea insulae]